MEKVSPKVERIAERIRQEHRTRGGIAILMRGIPGSGKSTIAKYISEFLDWAPICSADSYRYKDDKYVYVAEETEDCHAKCLKKYIKAVSTDYESAIVDNTNADMFSISAYLAVARAFEYKVFAVTLDVSPETGIARNLHDVPETRIRKMHKKLKETVLPPHVTNFELKEGEY